MDSDGAGVGVGVEVTGVSSVAGVGGDGAVLGRGINVSQAVRTIKKRLLLGR